MVVNLVGKLLWQFWFVRGSQYMTGLINVEVAFNLLCNDCCKSIIVDNLHGVL